MADISKINIESGTYDIKDNRVLSANMYNVPTIMIGDSYAVGESNGTIITGWCDRLKSLLNLSNDNYHKIALSGCGFSGYPNFLSGLQAYDSNITDKNSIKSIIVCGGYNDARLFSNYQSLQTGIDNFINYCNTNYPNAVVYIGMVGNSGDRSQTGIDLRNLLNSDILVAYQIGKDNSKTRYLNGVENILKYNNLISADNIHPTDAGYMYMAQWIYKAYTTGYCQTFSTYQDMSLTSNATTPVSSITGTISCAIHNDVVSVLCNTGLTVVYPTLQEYNQTAITLCNFNSQIFLPCKQLDVIVKFYTSDDDATSQGEYLYGGIGVLKFNGDFLSLDTQAFRQGEHGFLSGAAIKRIVIKPFTFDTSIRNV